MPSPTIIAAACVAFLASAAPAAAQFSTETQAPLDGLADQLRTVGLGTDGEYLVVGDTDDIAYVLVRDASGVWLLDGPSSIFVPSGGSDPALEFGSAIAVFDGTVVIGAYRERIDGIPNAGAIYVFQRDALGIWSQVQRIPSPTPNDEGSFGHALALQRDRLVVGAPLEDAAGADYEGAVHVFRQLADGTFVHEARLTASDGGKSDRFGHDVGLWLDRVVIGAPDWDQHFTSEAGAAYVFEEAAPGNWVEVQRLEPLNPVPDGSFGRSVAVRGGRIAVGIPSGGVTAPPSAGEVRVFDRDGQGVWQPGVVLTGSTASAGAGFGRTVRMDADRIAVGSAQGAGELNTGGSVFTFERDASGAWYETGRWASSPSAVLAAAGRELVLLDDGFASSSGGSVLVFEDRPLRRGRHTVSAATGGKQALTLAAGEAHAFGLWAFAGSTSGTAPTSTFPGIGVELPLVLDAYTDAMIDTLGGPVQPWLGFLDQYGRGVVEVDVPPLDPALAGTTLHHAFVVFDVLAGGGVALVSNPVALTIEP